MKDNYSVDFGLLNLMIERWFKRICWTMIWLASVYIGAHILAAIIYG